MSVISSTVNHALRECVPNTNSSWVRTADHHTAAGLADRPLAAPDHAARGAPLARIRRGTGGEDGQQAVSGVNTSLSIDFEGRSQTLAAPGPWTVGRSPPCDVRIYDPRVGRQHATVLLTPDG